MALSTKKLIPLDDSIVVSSDSFRDSINYERTRVDRIGGIFSVIVIRYLGADQNSINRLSSEILRRKRAIDCVGWNVDGAISILLPETTRQGAEVFCQKLSDCCIEESSIDIYHYPDNWLENSDSSIDIVEVALKDALSNKRCIESLFVRKMPIWKRTLDLVASTVLLLLLLPLFILVGFFIKIVSPGPIFFQQTRIGYRGIPFTFWKFRTMKHNNNESIHGKHLQSYIKGGDVPMKKLDENDPRIITGGRLIRTTCIDELPQLWNVLKGDMSLVGPRPCIPYETQDYLRWHTHRFDSVPGLTGLWQVNGKEKLTFKEMIRLDIAYCKNLSFLKDLYILFKTPFVIMEMILNSIMDRSNKA